jgi:hypothetical protein
MDGFNIIMIIAIILFARLGIRLIIGYKKKRLRLFLSNINTLLSFLT